MVVKTDCVICEEGTPGCAVCKVCGMHTNKPAVYNDFFSCSEKCVNQVTA